MLDPVVQYLANVLVECDHPLALGFILELSPLHLTDPHLHFLKPLGTDAVMPTSGEHDPLTGIRFHG